MLNFKRYFQQVRKDLNLFWAIMFAIACLAIYNARKLYLYTRIETPLYKWWWKKRVACIQNALDKQHAKRRQQTHITTTI